MSIYSYAPARPTKPVKQAPAPEVQFGKFTCEGKDLPPQPATYEKLAVGPGDELLLVSLVAESNFAKAIRAILGGGAKAHIKATGAPINKPGIYGPSWEPEKLKKSEEGYDFHTQKLDHGLVHCMLVSRRPGFMPSITDEALWQQLKSDRYTTPLLRGWIGHIKAEMLRLGHLQMAASFRCQCGILEATEPELDKIVSDGLRSGQLLIS